MSVLLSWHEKVQINAVISPCRKWKGADILVVKVVEIAGPGSIVRVMTDRRTI